MADGCRCHIGIVYRCRSIQPPPHTARGAAHHKTPKAPASVQVSRGSCAGEVLGCLIGCTCQHRNIITGPILPCSCGTAKGHNKVPLTWVHLMPVPRGVRRALIWRAGVCKTRALVRPSSQSGHSPLAALSSGISDAHIRVKIRPSLSAQNLALNPNPVVYFAATEWVSAARPHGPTSPPVVRLPMEGARMMESRSRRPIAPRQANQLRFIPALSPPVLRFHWSRAVN